MDLRRAIIKPFSSNSKHHFKIQTMIIILFSLGIFHLFRRNIVLIGMKAFDEYPTCGEYRFMLLVDIFNTFWMLTVLVVGTKQIFVAYKSLNQKTINQKSRKSFLNTIVIYQLIILVTELPTSILLMHKIYYHHYTNNSSMQILHFRRFFVPDNIFFMVAMIKNIRGPLIFVYLLFKNPTFQHCIYNRILYFFCFGCINKKCRRKFKLKKTKKVGVNPFQFSSQNMELVCSILKGINIVMRDQNKLSENMDQKSYKEQFKITI